MLNWQTWRNFVRLRPDETLHGQLRRIIGNTYSADSKNFSSEIPQKGQQIPAEVLKKVIDLHYMDATEIMVVQKTRCASFEEPI